MPSKGTLVGRCTMPRLIARLSNGTVSRIAKAGADFYKSPLAAAIAHAKRLSCAMWRT